MRFAKNVPLGYLGELAGFCQLRELVDAAIHCSASLVLPLIVGEGVRPGTMSRRPVFCAKTYCSCHLMFFRLLLAAKVLAVADMG